MHFSNCLLPLLALATTISAIPAPLPNAEPTTTTLEVLEPRLHNATLSPDITSEDHWTLSFLLEGGTTTPAYTGIGSSGCVQTVPALKTTKVNAVNWNRGVSLLATLTIYWGGGLCGGSSKVYTKSGANQSLKPDQYITSFRVVVN